MCGIIGVFGKLNRDYPPVEDILTRLRHRGPDDRGIVRGRDFFLGHQRLSIIDTKKGHQPIQSQADDINLVCNGEIYNYKQLKNQLKRSYKFKTKSDSEVIIPLYQEEGYPFVNNLDGMFSFIIYSSGEYLIVRDPLGIKPLYYGIDGNCIYFSSEIKAITDQAKHIFEFPNGYYYHSDRGFVPYFSLPNNISYINDIEFAIQKIRDLLKCSVKKRLMSDVPVGVFLSGGLDSSIIAALMKQYIPHLHSFSVGFSGSPDIRAARLVADYLGTIHHEYLYTENEMLEVLPKVIYHLESFDPALVRSSIPCYLVSKLASQYVKVILSGEGSDELFAGYSYFSDYDDPRSFQNESVRILKGLHNINLQRVDRMTMAHGLEGRVPFLDIEFIETCLNIDPYLKMPNRLGIEKWILRKAFEDILPSEIVWRDKLEFAQGCGSSDIFEKRASSISEEEFRKAQISGDPVSSKEEKLYYDIFKQTFDHPDVKNLVGKWQGTLH